MEVVLKIDSLGSDNLVAIEEGKPITITGEMIAAHFFDGAIGKAFENAQKFDDIKETLTPSQKAILEE